VPPFSGLKIKPSKITVGWMAYFSTLKKEVILSS
jgi:hypothetical protein